MPQAIKISDENYKLVCQVAKEERRSKKAIIDRALENFFKMKGVLKEATK